MSKSNTPTPETITALQELALTLKTIYLRLKNDGYRIIDGVLIEPAT